MVRESTRYSIRGITCSRHSERFQALPNISCVLHVIVCPTFRHYNDFFDPSIVMSISWSGISPNINFRVKIAAQSFRVGLGRALSDDVSFLLCRPHWTYHAYDGDILKCMTMFD